MSIQYTRLFQMLKKKEVSEYYLRKNGISSSILDKMKKGGHIDTRTIEKICNILECTPNDILEIVKEG